MPTTASARKSAPIQRNVNYNNQATGTSGQRPNDDTPAAFYFLVIVMGIALLGAIIYAVIA